MSDLTKDWKDGKLPAGWYYIKIADIVFIDFFEGKVWKNKKDEYIDEVLAPVPSYEQWQKHRKTLLKTQEKNCDLEIINTQLKELLKECKEVIKNVDTYYGNYDSINGYLVINKIDEVLK